MVANVGLKPMEAWHLLGSTNQYCGSIMAKRFFCFALICVVLLFLAIHVCVYEKPLADKETVVLEPFDRILLHKNETSLIEVPLPELSKGQCVQVNLAVRKGFAELSCLDEQSNEICASEQEGVSITRYSIPYDNDYRLMIDTQNADFTLIVTVLDDSMI